MKNLKTIFFSLIVVAITSCGSDDSKQINSNSSSESTTTMETCPHCDGLGRRPNSITGEMQDCNSCGGDGKVTQEQYNRLAK